MIGQLTGKLVKKQPPYLMLEVHGVGYELEASMNTCYALGQIGEDTRLYTHMAVRDDAHLLFAFIDEAERQLFRDLIKVNGIGTKVALAILSGMVPSELIHCIQNADYVRLTTLPGIGKKTAERLVMEMRDRLASSSEHQLSKLPSGSMHSGIEVPVIEATSALQALGYKPAEAVRLVSLVNAEGLNSEQIIRAALQASVK